MAKLHCLVPIEAGFEGVANAIDRAEGAGDAGAFLCYLMGDSGAEGLGVGREWWRDFDAILSF